MSRMVMTAVIVAVALMILALAMGASAVTMGALTVVVARMLAVVRLRGVDGVAPRITHTPPIP